MLKLVLLSVFVAALLLDEAADAQTFHYSHGWTNGKKRAAPAVPAAPAAPAAAAVDRQDFDSVMLSILFCVTLCQRPRRVVWDLEKIQIRLRLEPLKV